MNAKIALCSILLVAMFIPFALAATGAEGVTEQISQSNRFLSAEAAKQFTAMEASLLTDLKAYQDENFGMLDARMIKSMQDTRWQVLLATIGAVFVSSGLVAYLMLRSMKNYSYETYLEKLIGKGAQNEQVPQNTQDQGLAGLQNMQQPEWKPQEPNPTVSTQFGQSAASQMTQMNAWQMQPAYNGSWESPEKPQSDVKIPESRLNGWGPAPNWKMDSQDPMDSPGWNPKEGTQ